jgi:hypothetical protein
VIFGMIKYRVWTLADRICGWAVLVQPVVCAFAGGDEVSRICDRCGGVGCGMRARLVVSYRISSSWHWSFVITAKGAHGSTSAATSR